MSHAGYSAHQRTLERREGTVIEICQVPGHSKYSVVCEGQPGEVFVFLVLGCENSNHNHIISMMKKSLRWSYWSSLGNIL